MENKKAVMGPVISVFVMVLVIAILAGLTFLFVAALKTNVVTTTSVTGTVTNESQLTYGVAWLNQTGYTLKNASQLAFANPVITAIWASNDTDYPYNLTVSSSNYTITSAGVLRNATTETLTNISVSYTFLYINSSDRTAYDAVNDTEAAGATIVGYLPLIFLALIFGAILTLVLKIILPYINLGQTMGGF